MIIEMINALWELAQKLSEHGFKADATALRASTKESALLNSRMGNGSIGFSNR